MKYVIKDWAGNILFNDLKFADFETAWEYLYEFFHEEDNFEEYHVEAVA